MPKPRKIKVEEKKTDTKYQVTFHDREGMQDFAVNEVIEAFNQYTQAKNPGVVKVFVTNGKKTIDRVMFALMARRVFNNKLSRELYARNLERAF